MKKMSILEKYVNYVAYLSHSRIEICNTHRITFAHRRLFSQGLPSSYI